MGDGVYNFLCSDGENTKIYDILDRYIIDTLDRAKPHRKGSPEEIEDYLDEFQRLHSLAIVSARVTSSPEVSTILKETWRHVHPDLDKKTDEDSNIVVKRKKIVHSHEQTASIGLRQSQYNPKSIQPPPLPSMPPTSAINSSIAQNNESILTARPPAPPRPPGIHKAHNSNATRTQHSRQRRSSSASSLNSQGSPDQPAYLKMLADDSDDFPPPPPEAFLDNQLTNSSYYEGTQTTGRVKSSLERRRQAQSLDNESQKATSCEDLRSSKKNMVFHRPDSVDSLDVIVAETDENMNHAKPPVPFPKLQAYKGTDDKFERDRSQSIDYYNVRRESAPINSPSPSARHIRKILAQKRQTSHDVLRKSNSNPNFLNLGSKQDLRALSNGIRSPTDDSPTLSHKNKHASRSLASLLPGNIRRAISRERVPGDMVDSRSNTPTHSRSNSVDRSSMRRKRSNSVRGPNIKSITKTEKTRSFRREKSFKPNVQTTEQSINNQNGLPRSLTVINGQAINVSADVANNNMQAKPERRRKLNLSFGPADRIKNLPSPEREETRC